MLHPVLPRFGVFRCGVPVQQRSPDMSDYRALHLGERATVYTMRQNVLSVLATFSALVLTLSLLYSPTYPFS